MPNLYFCQRHARNQGMLRAVLTLDDCKHVQPLNSATYVGDHFPSAADGADRPAEFAVLSVSSAEADARWRSGYYRCDADLTELNALLQKLAR